MQNGIPESSQSIAILENENARLERIVEQQKQGGKEMQKLITLHNRAITKIAHHIQDQGNAKHFCTSGVDLEDGTAEEICDYITKINDEIKYLRSVVR